MEYMCPYSKDGKCSACRVLRINCDGAKYWLCEQYIITTAEAEEDDNGV